MLEQTDRDQTVIKAKMAARSSGRTPDTFSNKTSRSERFAQMSKQEELIEQKKKELAAKAALKKKEADDATKKLSTSVSTSVATSEKAKPTTVKKLWRRRGFDTKWKPANKEPAEQQQSAPTTPTTCNVFDNDGSFLEQFKKQSLPNVDSITESDHVQETSPVYSSHYVKIHSTAEQNFTPRQHSCVSTDSSSVSSRLCNTQQNESPAWHRLEGRRITEDFHSVTANGHGVRSHSAPYSLPTTCSDMSVPPPVLSSMVPVPQIPSMHVPPPNYNLQISTAPDPPVPPQSTYTSLPPNVSVPPPIPQFTLQQSTQIIPIAAGPSSAFITADPNFPSAAGQSLVVTQPVVPAPFVSVVPTSVVAQVSPPVGAAGVVTTPATVSYVTQNLVTAHLTPAAEQLAQMVAEGGDDIEDMARLKNQDDPSMQYLYHTDSPMYRQYRALVLRLRAEAALSLKRSCDGHEGDTEGDSQDVREGRAASAAERKKKRSRWGPASSQQPASVPQPGSSGQVFLTKVSRTDPQLVAYAQRTYGTTALSEEQWQQAEDHYKMNLMYQEMLRKKAEHDRLERRGQHKYEYDSDEEVEGGTWEHKLRSQEMELTQIWAEELTKKADGKHHIGDFLPPDELQKFLEKYRAIREDRDPDFSDYKEHKISEDNVGFQMLKKIGWSEGTGLGAENQGIVAPINKATQRVENQGLGIERPDDINKSDDEYAAYRKRMMLAYRFRPNPLNNPRRAYY